MDDEVEIMVLYQVHYQEIRAIDERINWLVFEEVQVDNVNKKEVAVLNPINDNVLSQKVEVTETKKVS